MDEPLHAKVRRMAPRAKVICGACHFPGFIDFQWAHLCLGCATKIREIDKQAESPAGIHQEMRYVGITVRLKRGHDV